MMDPRSDSRRNASTLDAELDWARRVFDARFDQYFANSEADVADFEIRQVVAPDLSDDRSAYADLVRERGFDFDERLVLILALIPHVRPQLLDLFFLQNKILGRPYTEFGGIPGKVHSGFLPTCETASFVLAGRDLRRRLEVHQLFDEQHAFHRFDIIKVEHSGPGEPFWGASLRLSHDVLTRMTTGQSHKPDFGAGFPAKRIASTLSWSDLVLAPEVMDEVAHLCAWLSESATIHQKWGISKVVKPGYRCLFYGPPGTGKTLTASLIGAQAGVDVYRIDLSMVVSKYIGETEKNLANVFDQAQSKKWILFFDEADALFGKRTQSSSSNDRHANQEISYLLQRVEDFPGMVILASNLKSNIDEAFARRFQSAIYFPVPDADQRIRLWKGLFPDTRLGPDVNLDVLAEKYELAGGALINVARYAAIRAHRQKREHLLQADLLGGVVRELLKEGKSL